MSNRIMIVSVFVVLAGVMFISAAQNDADKKPIRVAGRLTNIDGKKLTIASGGNDVVIICNDATKVARDSSKSIAPVTLSDLRVGQLIRAFYSKPDNSAVVVIIARTINESANNDMTSSLESADVHSQIRFAGELTKIERKTLMVASEGKDVVVTCNNATKISRETDKELLPAKFEDLQVGQQLRVHRSKTDAGAFAVIITKAVPGAKPAH